eukprot:403368949
MALINYSNRDVTKFLVSNNPDIGPGSYEVKSSYQNFDKKFKNVKPPPFGKGSGMSQNQTNINSYLREHHYTPGPGQYDTKKVNSSFDSQVIVNVDQEQGVYFVVKNGALQKKTQMLAADKTKKGFDVINQSMKINNPGPGAYTPINLQKSFEKIGMQKQNPRNLSPRTGLTNKQYKSVSISKDPIGENGQQNNQYKLTSVPSIPSKSQLIIVQKHQAQYRQSSQDQSFVDHSIPPSGNISLYSTTQMSPLIKTQTVSTSIMAQINTNEKEQDYKSKLGPGMYEPKLSDKKAGVSVWSKSKMQRKLWFEQNNQTSAYANNKMFQTSQFNNSMIREQALEEDVQLQRVEKYVNQQRQAKVNKMIQSNKKFGVRRPFSIGEFEHKFMKQNQVNKSNLQESDLDDSEEDDKYKNATPGPGSYYNPNLQSSIKKQYKEQKHQFFGSSEDRFKGSVFQQGDDPHQGTNNFVGPGSYNLRKDFLNKQRLNETMILPYGEIKRVFDVDNETLEKPGPGNYEVKDLLNHKKNFSKSIQAAFGSSDSRKITNPNETISPGPGAYQDAKQNQNTTSQAIFKSQTKRAIESFMINDASFPSSADYSLQHYKGTSYNQLQGGAPNNILVLKRAVQKQIERSLDKSPINSSKIITQATTLDQYQNIGPGMYSPFQNDSFNDTSKKRGHAKKNTFTKSNRFELVNTEKKLSMLPGPGHYDRQPYIEQSDWLKRTFNLRYLQNGKEVLRSKSQINALIL